MSILASTKACHYTGCTRAPKDTSLYVYSYVGCRRVVLKNNYSTPKINNIYGSSYICTVILVVSSCVHFVS
jgi:hypothetical protein